MSMIMNLTDDEWYCFICGFQAGLRVKDIQAPLFQSETVLHPIAVGGQGQRGLGVSDVYTHQGQSSYVTTVFTHDIDVEYSGFSCLIKFDPSVMQVTGVTEGQFGTISTQGNTDIRYEVDNVNGYFYALGLKPASVKYKKQQALFFISWNISTLPQNGEPYYIEFTGGQASTAGSTLLQYYEHDGIQDLQVISPCLNSRGTVYSPSTPVQLNEAKMGDESGVGLAASPRIEKTQPYNRVAWLGEKSAAGMYVYYAPKTAGSKVKMRIAIPTDYPDILFNYLNVSNEGTAGWQVNSTTVTTGTTVIKVYQNGEIVDSEVNALKLEMEFERTADFEDVSKFTAQGEMMATMEFSLNTVEPAPSVGYIPMVNEESAFWIDGEWQAVECLDGSIEFDDSGLNPYRQETGRTSPGVMGHGKVWAAQDGMAYIRIAGTNTVYPVYLHAGENDIEFEIFLESDTPMAMNIQLEIDATGYVEVMQGFTWDVASGLGAPPLPPQAKPIDDLKFRDFHDIMLIHSGGGLDQDVIDDIGFNDLHDVDIESQPTPPVGELTSIDDLSLDDLVEVIIEGSGGGDDDNEINNFGVEDFCEVDI